MMEGKVLCYADFAIRDKRETLITYYKVFSLSLQVRYTRIGRIYLNMYYFRLMVHLWGLLSQNGKSLSLDSN